MPPIHRRARRPRWSSHAIFQPGGGFDVLMLRRNDKVAFMGGAYVFPGGRVDDRDAAPARARRANASARHFADLTPAEEWAYRTRGRARDARKRRRSGSAPRTSCRWRTG